MKIFGLVIKTSAREEDDGNLLNHFRDYAARMALRVSDLQYENTELKAEIYRLAGEKSELAVECKHFKDAAMRMAQPQPLQSIVMPCQACAERRIADLNRNGEEKRDLEKQNDAQAARAMSRNTKQAFQTYQAAVKQILDKLNDLGKSNVVTKEDLRRLRQLRKDLGDQIGRSI